jgi:hypothetical protein
MQVPWNGLRFVYKLHINGGFAIEIEDFKFSFPNIPCLINRILILIEGIL